MTEHIPNVLPYIQELKEIWRKQDFKFSRQQQEEYDLLLATRRERVAQMLFAPVPLVHVEEVALDELESTERGEGGFGSSGQY